MRCAKSYSVRFSVCPVKAGVEVVHRCCEQAADSDDSLGFIKTSSEWNPVVFWTETALVYHRFLLSRCRHGHTRSISVTTARSFRYSTLQETLTALTSVCSHSALHILFNQPETGFYSVFHLPEKALGGLHEHKGAVFCWLNWKKVQQTMISHSI